MRQLLERLYPLNRTLVSDGTDEALAIVAEYLPEARLLRYPTGEPAWTWEIPPRWLVHRATLACNGKVIADFDWNPLHLVSYSAPFSGNISFDELAPHLHSREDQPDAIPFVFSFYKRDWGFCLPHHVFEQLDHSAHYQVDIQTEFVADAMSLLEYDVPGSSSETVIIVADICHPYQVNDSITGVVLAVQLARILREQQNRKSYKFLFLPETIGSIAYLSRNEDLIQHLIGGIYTEFLGTGGRINFQRSLGRESPMDRAALLALDELEIEYNDVDLGDIPTNDEKVFNDPDVRVPMIAFNRWPYDEYHTSHDTPAIISIERIEEVLELVVKVLKIVDQDFVPVRRFRGPLFLSGYDLHRNSKVQNQILRLIDGHHSVVDIALRSGFPFSKVNEFVTAMLDKGLVVEKSEAKEEHR